MAVKILDMKKSVYDLATEFPEVIDIMVTLGFRDISNPVALNTMGRVMTIPKGSKIKGIDMTSVIAMFEDKGFEIINAPESEYAESTEAAVKSRAASQTEAAAKPANASERELLLRSYVERLTKGEALEAVRTDFVENFKEVDALEIANAEQHLIKSGVPYQEVQKLCDVHSALFHGATKQEQSVRIAASSKEAHERSS